MSNINITVFGVTGWFQNQLEGRTGNIKLPTGVLRKRFRLQRRAVLAAGAERVPTGGDCASRIAAYDLRKNAGADAGASGCRPRRRVAETLSAATPCGSCRASAKVPTGEPAGAGME